MKKLAWLILMAVVICNSCTLCRERGKAVLSSDPHVHVRLVHQGKQPVEKARVRIGEFTTISTGLGPGGSLTHVAFDHLAETADVIYRLHGSQEDKVIQVGLPALPNKNIPQITLIFRLNADSNTASVVLREGAAIR